MTELIYLQNTYLFESETILQEVGENEQGMYLILDQTIFYPQWGGQPTDVGIISTESGVFEVTKVRLDESGVVYNFWTMISGDMHVGETVHLKIDRENRLRNARNHSAWHLIDVAMKNLAVPLTPTKWYHFSDGPYVEYRWEFTWDIEDLRVRLEKEVNALILQNIPLVVWIKEDVISPLGKAPRYVNFEWSEWCGCGGTHVRSSGEIGQMEIRKIKMKDGALRVSYGISI